MTDQELATVCELRAQAAAVRDAHQAVVDDLSSQIGAELSMRGTQKVELPAWIPMVVEMERTTLDKTKLLESGVTPGQIEAATVRKASVQVRVLKRHGNG